MPLVLGVHESDEEAPHVLLDVLDLVDPLADDVVQLEKPLRVVRLHVHEGVDAVVGLGEVGEEVLHLVAVPKKEVDLPLQHVVGEDVLLHRLVAGVEDCDPLAEPAVEAVGTHLDHAEDLGRVLEPRRKGLEDGGADGAWRVAEDPVVLLLGEELPLEGIVLEQVVEEGPALRLVDHEERAVVRRAGDLDDVAAAQ
jgi:hypothetical protein